MKVIYTRESAHFQASTTRWCLPIGFRPLVIPIFLIWYKSVHCFWGNFIWVYRPNPIGIWPYNWTDQIKSERHTSFVVGSFSQVHDWQFSQFFVGSCSHVHQFFRKRQGILQLQQLSRQRIAYEFSNILSITRRPKTKHCETIW